VCKRGDRRILDGVSFDVERGETLVLLGRSGSGKTTAIRLINRLLDFESGEVLLEGSDIRKRDVIELRRRIGYVIQEIGLLPHRTVAQNIALVPQLQGWPAQRVESRVGELLAQIGLPSNQYADRLPCNLSGGQRQRVGVARALAAEPAMLLLDEPFGALDPITRQEMQQQFIALRQRYETPAIFVTHDVMEALTVGTRIAVLDSGKLEVLASRDEFLRVNTPVASSFLATVNVLRELRHG
jgi:osmoprotectant transport system ATP-binding protein